MAMTRGDVITLAVCYGLLILGPLLVIAVLVP